jgi:hypothetical protein
MKKTLVLVLALVLAFAVATVASASEISTSLGGDFYYYYQTKNNAPKVVSADDTAVSYGSITAKVTEGNTWAKLWMHMDIWKGTIGNSMFYAVGMDKIADVFTWQFSSKDTNYSNVGQTPLTEYFNRYRADPFFNAYDLNGNLAGKIETENFYLGADFSVVNQNDINNYAVSASFKFDGGDVHVGYKNENAWNEAGSKMTRLSLVNWSHQKLPNSAQA